MLVVDDDYDLLMVLKRCLEAVGCRVDICQSLAEMAGRIRQFAYDAVLVDLFLQGESGVATLPILAREAPHAVVMVMTAHATFELAAEAMDNGASGFVAKGDDPSHVARELAAKLHQRRPKMILGSASDLEIAGLIGESPAMRKVHEALRKVCVSNAPILITGEPGTGKKTVARMIHRMAPRASGRFEALNCAAIPEMLLEVELFGRHGTSNEALVDRRGIFELCSDGSLVLDEIAEMPWSIQTKLLRVLQEKEIVPVGSAMRIKVGTRVVAVTSRDLEDEVLRGRFRDELFYRLNVLTIHLPPLRERFGDLPKLVMTMLDKFNRRYGKNMRMPSRKLFARLEGYSWPGNVRELENAIERAVVLFDHDELAIDDILQRKIERRRPGGIDMLPGEFINSSYAEAKEQFERAFLARTLTVARGTIVEATRHSGSYRTDICRLLERYKIDAEQFKV